MGWSYRKRIKIIPGIHLNFSKGGISTSIGVRGANITLSKKGTYLNTGIPGTGIYNRQRISNPNPNNHINQPNTNPIFVPAHENKLIENGIFSADIEEITSQDLQGVKDTIIKAIVQKKDLQNDLQKVNSELTKSKNKLKIGKLLIFGFIVKSWRLKIEENIRLQEEAITQISEQIDNCIVNVDVNFDEQTQEKFEMLVNAFQFLCGAKYIWHITSEKYEDRRLTRSFASTFITKQLVRFGNKDLPIVRTNYNPLYLENVYGTDIYIFPSFLIMFSSIEKFAMIPITDIVFTYTNVDFIEKEIVPPDSKIINKTWDKVNKDGSPDRRFSGNYEIPIVQYGEIIFKTESGMHEVYQISNCESAQLFGFAFTEYQRTIKNISTTVPEIDDEEGIGEKVDLKNRDILFEDCAKYLAQTQVGSISNLMLHFSLGYNRAGHIMEQLEAAGVVGPANGSKLREVYFTSESDLEDFLESLD